MPRGADLSPPNARMCGSARAAHTPAGVLTRHALPRATHSEATGAATGAARPIGRAWEWAG
eukprot:12548053-Alexandrium_andersonii.AAC.1